MVTAYKVATLVLLLPCAKLGDLVGHRRVYLGGLILFTAASLACALAPSLTLLVVARTVQGLGAGGLMSVNGALVRLTYPARKLGRGIALNSLIVATASVAGPSTAAAVLSVTSWPWLFAINLPIGIVVTVLGIKALPRSTGRRDSGARLAPIDVAMNVLMFGLLALGFDALGTRLTGGSSLLYPGIGAALVMAGVVVGVLFMRRQRRQAMPLFPLVLLRVRVFALSMGTSIGAFAAQTMAYVALQFLLLEAYGRSHATTGLLITAWPIATVVTAPIAGRLIGKVADGTLGAVGLVLLASGLALLAWLPAEPEQCRHRLAHGAVRRRIRSLPVAEQPHDPDLGTAAAQRRRQRNARHGAPERTDARCGPVGHHLLGLRCAARARAERGAGDRQRFCHDRGCLQRLADSQQRDTTGIARTSASLNQSLDVRVTASSNAVPGLPQVLAYRPRARVHRPRVHGLDS